MPDDLQAAIGQALAKLKMHEIEITVMAVSIGVLLLPDEDGMHWHWTPH